VRDLLSQAEHDAEARAVLITTSESQAQAVAKRLSGLIPELPRKEIIQKSFARGSCIVKVASLAEGFDLVNEMAPEHLELITADPLEALTQVRNAGAVFLGTHTPEPVGDYFAGPNHTIPTGGRAKFSSPLSVQDFVKKTSILRYSAARLAQESGAIRRFAEREQLFAHAEAVRVRAEPAPRTVAAAKPAARPARAARRR
jgi:histidinol dehydrogenase